MAKVSIIVPVYRVEPYLRRCIDSVLGQTFGDFSLVLVDDGSPDKCGAICDEYAHVDRRVSVIHRTNGGLSAARNSGIDWVLANTKSDWLTFLDSDDWLHRDYVKALLQAATATGAKVAVGEFQRVDSFDEEMTARKADIPVASKMTLGDFADQCWQMGLHGRFVFDIACGKLYSRDCFTSIRFPEQVKAHEDTYTTYRVLYGHEAIAIVDYPLYFYYGNPESITGSRWSPARLYTVYGHQEQIEFFRDHGEHRAFSVAVRWQLDRIRWAISECRHEESCRQYIPELRSLLADNLKRYARMAQVTAGEYMAAYQFLHPWARPAFKAVRAYELGIGGIWSKLFGAKESMER